jgi:hypothetical protein
MAKITLGKESLNKLCAISGGKLFMFLQKVTQEGQTLLQEFEFGPFHNTELGLLDMALIDVTETRIHVTEIINPRDF